MTSSWPLANYQPERELVRGLCATGCDRRILLLRGASGVGKTSLLGACVEDLVARDGEIFCCPLDLRGSSIDGIFSGLSSRLGRDRLPRLEADMAADHSVRVSMDDVRLLGKDQQINVNLPASAGPEDRRRRIEARTERIFDDLRALPRPLVMSIDHYEKASGEVSDWIEGSLLGRVSNVEQLRVVVAGQTVPEPSSVWGRCWQQRELYGVKEADDWLPVVEGMGKQLPTGQSGWLAGVCHALEGHPGKIMKLIVNLPDRGSIH